MENDRLKSLNDGGYNNLLLIGLGATAVYLLVNGVNKTRQQLYLEQAGIDKPTQQAQALRDAMNKSGISYLMSVDGTDVDLIMQTASAIESYPAVSDAYRTLYGSELTLDLQNELSRTDLQKFYDIVYKRNGQGSTTTTTTTTSNGTVVTKTKSVVAIQTVNIRSFEKPTVIERQAKKGETIGTFDSEQDLMVTGTKTRFVVVKTAHVFDWLYDVKVYVHKASIKLV